MHLVSHPSPQGTLKELELHKDCLQIPDSKLSNLSHASNGNCLTTTIGYGGTRI